MGSVIDRAARDSADGLDAVDSASHELDVSAVNEATKRWIAAVTSAVDDAAERVCACYAADAVLHPVSVGVGLGQAGLVRDVALGVLARRRGGDAWWCR